MGGQKGKMCSDLETVTWKVSEHMCMEGVIYKRGVCGQVMMVALLGYTEEELDDKLQASLTESLKIWLRGLFSLPLNLPGFGKPHFTALSLSLSPSLSILLSPTHTHTCRISCALCA
jgi:hypothetical protein